ncbi:MAG: ABC-F family ATP-binding cassette domain-containing protein [Anaerolineaceae bacterium]
MSILTANNLGVSFGAFDLFKGISVTIANDSKIGLIGPNGVGKTTLLLILAGINQPTTGSVHLARGRRIGYLRQEAINAFGDLDNTLYAEMQSVFKDLSAQQEKLHELEHAMSSDNFSDELLEVYGRLQEAFERAGGYEVDQRIQQTLNGLGLGKDVWQMPLNHLSGGQKTRGLLARLLLESPDLLMLDEPTNHLDIEAVEWLERTLREWQGAVLIVSHDRYFLDNTVNSVWEMTSRGIEVFNGNYSAYLLQREERWDYYARVFEEEKARLLKEVDYVQRNWVRASTHAQALGRLRRLTRDLAIIDNYGIMALRSGKQWSEMGLSVAGPLDVVEAIRKVNAILMSSNRPRNIRPRLAIKNTSGTIVLRLKNVEIGYPGNLLFCSGEVEIRRGECIALIGSNGSGKTTFLKVLLDQIQPLGGEVRPGASLKIGYFAQAHDRLTGELSIYDELQSHKQMEAYDARSHLAQYLFKGDDVFKPLNALSGGERARLALAILALQSANFLLLDEPTNHLDIPAREALQEVLEGFQGTILLVSHDRYLIDRLATRIWELRDGRLEVFDGGYRQFTLQRAAGNVPKTGRQMVLAPKPLLRGNSAETRRKAQQLEMLEARIREVEVSIQALSRELQQTGQSQSFARTHQISNKLVQAQAQLDDMMEEWEKAVDSTCDLH